MFLAEDHEQQPLEKCRFWMKGCCRYGNACWYPHDHAMLMATHDRLQLSSSAATLPETDFPDLTDSSPVELPKFTEPFDQPVDKHVETDIRPPFQLNSSHSSESTLAHHLGHPQDEVEEDPRLVLSKHADSPIYLLSHKNIFGSTCRYWMQSTCNRGLACRFAHPIPNNAHFPVAKYLAAGHGALSKSEHIQLLPQMVTGTPRVPPTADSNVQQPLQYPNRMQQAMASQSNDFGSLAMPQHQPMSLHRLLHPSSLDTYDLNDPVLSYPFRLPLDPPQKPSLRSWDPFLGSHRQQSQSSFSPTSPYYDDLDQHSRPGGIKSRPLPPAKPLSGMAPLSKSAAPAPLSAYPDHITYVSQRAPPSQLSHSIHAPEALSSSVYPKRMSTGYPSSRGYSLETVHSLGQSQPLYPLQERPSFPPTVPQGPQWNLPSGRRPTLFDEDEETARMMRHLSLS